MAVTSDGVRLEVSGRLFFTLTSKEANLRASHEETGLSSGAFVNGGTEGMTATLNRYVLPQLDRRSMSTYWSTSGCRSGPTPLSAPSSKQR